MPITQDRMIALIRAAQSYQTGLNRACESAKSIGSRIAQGKLSLLDAVTLLSEAFNTPTTFLDNPFETYGTIKVEAEHFRRNRGKNAVIARYQRRKRAEATGQSISPADALRTRLESNQSLQPELHFYPAMVDADELQAQDEAETALMPAQMLAPGEMVTVVPPVSDEEIDRLIAEDDRNQERQAQARQNQESGVLDDGQKGEPAIEHKDDVE